MVPRISPGYREALGGVHYAAVSIAIKRLERKAAAARIL